MDLSALTSISSLTAGNSVNGLTGSSLIADSFPVSKEGKKTDGTMFDAILNTAIENINTTNAYLSDYENEEIKWALGETENTHDLTIALQKASTALQYTVAIRDKVLEAYNTIMNIQI